MCNLISQKYTDRGNTLRYLLQIQKETMSDGSKFDRSIYEILSIVSAGLSSKRSITRTRSLVPRRHHSSLNGKRYQVYRKEQGN